MTAGASELDRIVAVLCAEAARVLSLDPGDVSSVDSFGSLGMDSLGYVDIARAIQAHFGIQVQPEALFEHNSIRQTAAFVASMLSKSQPTVSAGPQPAQAQTGPRDIAIIGAALRFPGARSLEELAALIAGGEPQFQEVPDWRWGDDTRHSVPASLRAGVIDDADRFDAAFFGISPREALAMDPQQRLLMQCAWHALEDAGLSPAQLSGSNTAVFIGASSFDYAERLAATNAARTTHIGTGLSHAILANRISQYYDLRGASEAVDTACSSAAVALWRAVEALRRGDGDLVLVGGVNIFASPVPFRAFADAGMLSPHGRCVPFDADAAGYVRGEGVACLVLKRAAAALADRDRILALIKGGAVRHSGRTQSLTAPNPEAQAQVIVAAVEDAGIDPLTIGYVEAHGTGTALGDPIEIRGLSKAFASLHAQRGRTRPPAHCCIGSIKAQIGHLEAAAGLAGVLKAVAVLQRRRIPGNPHLHQINPLIQVGDTVLRIPERPLNWDGGIDGLTLSASPRRAGVSCFGFGGTNAHVILEEPPTVPARLAETRCRLYLLSARRAERLRQWSGQLASYLESRISESEAAEQSHLEDVAFTLRRARTWGAHRLAVPARDRQELVAKLKRFAEGGATDDLYAGEVPRNLRLSPTRAADEVGLAREWVQGGEVDWCAAIPQGQARITALPPYPFDGERFWPRAGAPQAAPEQGAPRVAYWTAGWEASPLPPLNPPLPSGSTVLLIVAGEKGTRLAAALKEALPSNAVHSIAAPEPDQTPQTAEALLARLELPPSAWIDATALDEDDLSNGIAAARLDFLRRVTAGSLKRGKALHVLQVTTGLQDLSAHGHGPSRLAGAALCGVYAYLSGEYKRCRSKSVDCNGAMVDDPTRLAAALAAELRADDTGQFAYIDGLRLARRLLRTASPASAQAHDSGGTALITGGTGEIGLQLARHLAHNGFRGLLLTGRRELTPDKRETVRELEASGVKVSFYRGELTDVPALAGAVDAFRALHGPVTHVFHCAGVADVETPALYQKTAASIARVMAPKVDALPVLHELFRLHPPQAFVLFSSISAAAPRLAAGALDYAAANLYLDLYAQVQRARGHRYYRSLQWTRWEDTGLARHARPANVRIGMPLPAAQCLAALEEILSAQTMGQASLCIAAEGDDLAASEAMAAPAPASAVADMPSQLTGALGATLQKVRTLVAKELEIEESRLDDHARFEELGIDSIVLLGLTEGIEEWIGRHIEPQTLIECNSILAVARYLANLAPVEVASPAAIAAVRSDRSASSAAPTTQAFRVAVIGIACHFPGAPDKESFWSNLAGGVDSVVEVPASRWNAAAFHQPEHADGRTISRWGGFIEGIEWTYPKLFGMSGEEAADVDPLVRLYTECSLKALLDTPFGMEGVQGKRVGVFVGARSGRYAERIMLPGRRAVTGVGQNFIAAHVSHLLDLHGPSLVVDTACSSSLAAVHLACQSLRTGDADMALAGGVEVLLDQKPYLFLSAAHALSPDGRCRPFSSEANGFVPGEGVGCVVLKPLERALADGDPVYAVIDGTAMNNDGRTLGVTTPGSDGQAEVIASALRSAGVEPRDISYVETHGTGTLIGDPIELQSLARAFSAAPPVRCAVGSVKSNIGHLLSAAGVASFIKVALSLHHRVLPPTLHCAQVNPRFDFARTPFFPVQRPDRWETDGRPRRAGISAFGFGKTNVHIVVAERPPGTTEPERTTAPVLPPALAGERVRAWHEAPAVDEPPATDAAALLALEEIMLEEQTPVAVES